MKNKSMFTTNIKRERNHFIDFLRGFAILIIIVDHYLISAGLGAYMDPFFIKQGVPIIVVVSGYVFSLSYEKNNYTQLSQPYSGFELLKKFIRIFIPYLFIFLIDQIIWCVNNGGISIQFLFDFLLGGRNYFGGYYYVIALQIPLMMPIIYFILKKYNLKGLVGLFVFTAFFELLWWAFIQRSGHTLLEYSDLYSFLGIRFTFTLACGSYFYLNRQNKINWLLTIIALVIGLTYALIDFTLLNIIMWSWCNCFFALYICAILNVIIKYAKFKHKWTGWVGVACFSFYLTQNFYYLNFARFPTCNNLAGQFFVSLCFIVLIAVPYYFIFEKYLSKCCVKGVIKLQNKFNQRHQH